MTQSLQNIIFLISIVGIVAENVTSSLISTEEKKNITKECKDINLNITNYETFWFEIAILIMFILNSCLYWTMRYADFFIFKRFFKFCLSFCRSYFYKKRREYIVTYSEREQIENNEAPEQVTTEVIELDNSLQKSQLSLPVQSQVSPSSVSIREKRIGLSIPSMSATSVTIIPSTATLMTLPRLVHRSQQPYQLKVSDRFTNVASITTVTPATTIIPSTLLYQPQLAHRRRQPYQLQVSDWFTTAAPITTVTPATTAIRTTLPYQPQLAHRSSQQPYQLQVLDQSTSVVSATTATPITTAIRTTLSYQPRPHGSQQPPPYQLQVSDRFTTAAPVTTATPAKITTPVAIVTLI